MTGFTKGNGGSYDVATDVSTTDTLLVAQGGVTKTFTVGGLYAGFISETSADLRYTTTAEVCTLVETYGYVTQTSVSSQGYLTSAGTESYTTTAEVSSIVETYGYLTSAITTAQTSALVENYGYLVSAITTAQTSALVENYGYFVSADATTTVKGVVEKATAAEVSAGTADKYPDAAELKTALDLKMDSLGDVSNTTTTTGTAVALDETIPTGTTVVEIVLNDVSTDGTSDVIIQLGDAGGYESSGYDVQVGGAASGGTLLVINTTSGIGVWVAGATANSVSGVIRLKRVDSATNRWIVEGFSYRSNATIGSAMIVGDKSLSAELDRIRITTVGGTDSFDAGSVDLRYV